MNPTTSQVRRTITIDEAQRLYEEVHPMSNGVLCAALTRVAQSMDDYDRPFAKMAILEAISRLEGGEA
jgi:hypothetical protein